MVTEVLNKVTQGKDSFGNYSICTGHEGSDTCFWCGGPFPDKRRRRFCCEGCRQEYDRHFFWPAAVAWCRERAGNRCHDCGAKQGENKRDEQMGWTWKVRLLTHHIIPLELGEKRVFNKANNPDNLMLLCPSCHGKRHAGMGHKKTQGISVNTERGPFAGNGTEPLPGWDWYLEHREDPYPEPSIEVGVDGRMVSLHNCRKGDIKAVMRG